MTFPPRVGSWLRSAFRRSALEREMEQEWRFHVESRAADLVGTGVSRERAEQQARAEFGATPKWREESREPGAIRC